MILFAILVKKPPAKDPKGVAIWVKQAQTDDATAAAKMVGHNWEVGRPSRRVAIGQAVQMTPRGEIVAFVPRNRSAS